MSKSTGFPIPVPSKPEKSVDKLLISAVRGAHDILRESARQHRARGDDGFSRMCDMHADEIAKYIQVV